MTSNYRVMVKNIYSTLNRFDKRNNRLTKKIALLSARIDEDLATLAKMKKYLKDSEGKEEGNDRKAV